MEAMAGVIWWQHVHKAHTTSTWSARFVGLVQMGGTNVCERGRWERERERTRVPAGVSESARHPHARQRCGVRSD
jgi:hypothetical protein